MKAAVIRSFGSPEALGVETVPDPALDAGHLVIEVEYASVTFVDTQIRAGRAPNPAMTPRLPLIPGNGVGGRIVEAGSGGDPGLLGRAVVSTTGGSGGYAERAAVPPTLPIPIPPNVSTRDAVALLADGRTALGLLRAAGVASGETVLIEAAAGGVGSCLIQLARAAGAIVVACAGSSRKVQVAEQLGATYAVDYARRGWEQLIRDKFDLVDVVFDGVGGTLGATAMMLLRPEGRLCRYGMASGSFTETAAAPPDVEIVDGIRLSPERSRQLSIEALDLAASGQLLATIGQEYPLERAADAHSAIEARATIGKTLLRVSSGHNVAWLRSLEVLMPDGLPIACALSATDLRVRLAQMTDLGKSSLVDVQLAPLHAELRFAARPGVRERVESVAEHEAECCPFLTLRVSDEPGLVVLQIDAPSDAEGVLSELAAAFESE